MTFRDGLFRIMPEMPENRSLDQGSVRLRTSADKRYKKVANATALIRRVLMVAEKSFRRLDSPELLLEVAEGAAYEDARRGGRRLTDDYTPIDETST